MRISIPLPNARGRGRTRLTGSVALHGNVFAKAWQVVRLFVAMVVHEVLEWIPSVDAHANRWAVRYALGASPVYDSLIQRGESPDPLVPEPIVGQIISALPQASAVLSRVPRTIPLASSINRVPVMDVLPVAYFVNGDTGLKQTTRAAWKNVFLNVEEIAVLLPVPDAYLDDSAFPIWDSVRPLLVEAIGQVLDGAVFFGTNKPASWDRLDIVSKAIAAGNVVTAGTGDDLAVDIAELGVTLAGQGFGLNGFASEPGLTWKLNQLRAAGSKEPIYQPNLQGGIGAMLYGFGFSEVMNGSWDSSSAMMIGGDWSKLVVGIRRDITFTPHTDGVISDGEGVVIFNAMQQDSTIFRAVFRVAAAVANPVTRLEGVEANRFPFAILEPEGS